MTKVNSDDACKDIGEIVWCERNRIIDWLINFCIFMNHSTLLVLETPLKNSKHFVVYYLFFWTLFSFIKKIDKFSVFISYLNLSKIHFIYYYM